MENVLVRTSGKETWKESEWAGVETTKGCQVLGESDGKRVWLGWKVCRVSDVGLRRVGAVGLGNRARQEFARGRSRWCCDAGAWQNTARHRMDMALRHRGAHGDDSEVQ